MIDTTRMEAVWSSLAALNNAELDVLLERLRQLRIERRRAEIVANIAESRREYAAGLGFRGSAEEMIAELHRLSEADDSQ